MDTYLQLINQTPKKVIIIYHHLMLPLSTVVSTIYDSYPHMKYESRVVPRISAGVHVHHSLALTLSSYTP